MKPIPGCQTSPPACGPVPARKDHRNSISLMRSDISALANSKSDYYQPEHAVTETGPVVLDYHTGHPNDGECSASPRCTRLRDQGRAKVSGQVIQFRKWCTSQYQGS